MANASLHKLKCLGVVVSDVHLRLLYIVDRRVVELEPLARRWRYRVLHARAVLANDDAAYKQVLHSCLVQDRSRMGMCQRTCKVWWWVLVVSAFNAAVTWFG